MYRLNVWSWIINSVLTPSHTHPCTGQAEQGLCSRWRHIGVIVNNNNTHLEEGRNDTFKRISKDKGKCRSETAAWSAGCVIKLSAHCCRWTLKLWFRPAPPTSWFMATAMPSSSMLTDLKISAASTMSQRDARQWQHLVLKKGWMKERRKKVNESTTGRKSKERKKHTYKTKAGILGGFVFQAQNGVNEKHWASRDEWTKLLVKPLLLCIYKTWANQGVPRGDQQEDGGRRYRDIHIYNDHNTIHERDRDIYQYLSICVCVCLLQSVCVGDRQTDRERERERESER